MKPNDGDFLHLVIQNGLDIRYCFIFLYNVLRPIFFMSMTITEKCKEKIKKISTFSLTKEKVSKSVTLA